MRVLLAFVFLVAADVQGLAETLKEPKPSPSREPRAAILIPRPPQELGSFPGMTRNNEICGIRRNAVPDIFTRIVGGSQAERNEFPWQVSLQFVSNWYTHHICGGTVIDQRWVLTAAHCTHNFESHQLLVVAGEHHLKRRHGEEQTRKVETIVEHPQYNVETQEYDIAMIKLSQPLVMDGVTVSPICLPPYLNKFTGNGVVTGWGNTKEDGESSDVLMKVVVPIISDQECRNSYRAIGYTGPIIDNMLCAGYSTGGKDACQGDSGGPFISLGRDSRYYLAGVVSWGIGCARPHVPGVYTEVSHFVPWVSDVISNRIAHQPRPVSLRLAAFDETQETTATAAEGKEEHNSNDTDDDYATITTSILQQ
ncbi:hypothetical protein O3P69_013376 [Scylla paramamosain]|uniref:Peptidase S1 domain-containing protein n=1 Tax=Scylla paramamosain TaxID=85552 RepID=A0AAW0U3E1_SCYPA